MPKWPDWVEHDFHRVCQRFFPDGKALRFRSPSVTRSPPPRQDPKSTVVGSLLQGTLVWQRSFLRLPVPNCQYSLCPQHLRESSSIAKLHVQQENFFYCVFLRASCFWNGQKTRPRNHCQLFFGAKQERRICLYRLAILSFILLFVNTCINTIHVCRWAMSLARYVARGFLGCREGCA